MWYNCVMKIGISTASLFPERHTEDALRTIKSLGVSVAEVFLSTFYEYRPEFSKSLKGELDGLKVNSVHTMPLNFEPNLFNATRRVRGDGFYWLDQVCRSAQLLGAENYTFHGFVRTGGADARADDIGFIGERIAEAHAFCGNYGVHLCIENTAHYAYNRPGFFRAVREYARDLYGVFDLKQARRSGYPYQAYIEDMSGAIAYAHLSDIDKNGKMCLPGKGVYDFAEIFKRLKGAGFDGVAVVENYRPDYGNADELKESVLYLQELADKA